MFHLLLSTLVAQTTNAAPVRPPDGTYTYSIAEATGPTLLTSDVVVKSDGATFDVSESVKLPNGTVATTLTTWDSATLLPLHYTLHQGAVNIDAPILPSAIKFNGAPLSYAPIAGTKFMVVSDGLNGFRMMIPFVVAAHPGESFTVAQINGNRTVQGEGSAATPPPNGPAGETVTMYTIENDRMAAWSNPQTHVPDRMLEMPTNSRMWLVKYTQPTP